ncbi:MAG: restriction endonuclease [Chloroflexi bacterium]|nr:HNH endonuclease [Anaerolineales bacterium]RIK55194.1 MAG: restriction endonuclease [Chloroflexota bacterium]
MSSNKWTREELILAFNLYCKIPFGTIHIRNPQVISLAKILNRTPSAVSWKLANLASLDPTLKTRNITGAPHGSKLDAEVWNEFVGDWDRLAFESEGLLAGRTGKQIEDATEIKVADLPRAGKEREAVIKVRVNQSFFRKAVLAAYDFRCCITGLEIPELLNASHIIPWSEDKANQVNPRNGLCLNALHDRAFDRGFLTVMPDLTIKLSKSIKGRKANSATQEFLLKYDGFKISKPTRFFPDAEFLKYHNRIRFKG